MGAVRRAGPPAPRCIGSPLWRILVIVWTACFCGQANAPAAEVAFDFLHNQIVLPVTIAGQGPYNFVLDTGTLKSAIDLSLARRLGLQLGAPAAVSGAGIGRAAGQRTVCPDLEIAGLAVGGLDAVAIDLGGMSQSLGRPLHGVLGFSFLDMRVARIDYFRRRIQFLPESPAEGRAQPGDGKSLSFPMRFRENSVLPVLTECYVNGVRLAVTLDTGSSLGLILFPRTVEKLGLGELARAGIPMRATGYLGQARLTKGWLRSVRLGPIDLGAIETAYVEKGYGDNEDPELRGGNVGNAVLQDFVLTLDYRSRTVTLERTVD